MFSQCLLVHRRWKNRCGIKIEHFNYQRHLLLAVPTKNSRKMAPGKSAGKLKAAWNWGRSAISLPRCYQDSRILLQRIYACGNPIHPRYSGDVSVTRAFFSFRKYLLEKC